MMTRQRQINSPVIEAGDQGSQSEAAPERHQPDLSEAIEELTEKFQMMLHLPSAQVRTAKMLCMFWLAAFLNYPATPICSCELQVAQQACEQTGAGGDIAVKQIAH